MADIKISQLGAAIAVGDTDLMPIVSGGNTLKATAAQVKEHSIGNTNISSIGDGSVTGAISTLNTDKQPKTLATPLTIGGVSKTTVEDALSGLVSENQTLSKSIAPIENGTNYSTTYYKNDEFWHNGVLCKVAASSVNSSTAISIGSNGNAIIINSFDRLRYVDKNISLTCAANSFTRVNVPIAVPETASAHRVAVAVQNDETVSAVLCGLGRVMLFTTATKTDASIELRIWYQD